MIKKLIKKAFNILGYELRAKNVKVNKYQEPPEVVSDINEYLYRQGSRYLLGEEVALEVDINKIVSPLGFRYAKDANNPFVDALIDGTKVYKESLLKEYFDGFQPKNAAEALGDSFTPSFKLRNYKPYTARFLLPWTNMEYECAKKRIERITIKENKEHGDILLGIDGGDLLMGPVSEIKGSIELSRLLKVYQSIKDRGYIRKSDKDGDIKVIALKNGEEFRYVLLSGTHRAASVAALMFDKIPVKLMVHKVIEKEDVSIWPQVKYGCWDKENASFYFDYLFKK